MSIPVVMYLRQSDRAFVAIAPPGASLPPSLTSDTIQVTVTQEQWQTLDASRQSLSSGQDLIVNPDGSSTPTLHKPNLAEQEESTLTSPIKAFASHPAPTDAMKEAALRAIIRHLGLDR